ncbi:phage infection protein [Pseudomonas borbori]
MKKQLLTALILASLSAGAFALPQDDPQPLLGEAKDSRIEPVIQTGLMPLAKGGVDRVGTNRLAEGGADRLQERLRVAEDGADRTGANRLAESGADRLQERLRIAEGGAERTLSQRAG